MQLLLIYFLQHKTPQHVFTITCWLTTKQGAYLICYENPATFLSLYMKTIYLPCSTFLIEHYHNCFRLSNVRVWYDWLITQWQISDGLICCQYFYACLHRTIAIVGVDLSLKLGFIREETSLHRNSHVFWKHVKYILPLWKETAFTWPGYLNTRRLPYQAKCIWIKSPSTVMTNWRYHLDEQ